MSDYIFVVQTVHGLAYADFQGCGWAESVRPKLNFLGVAAESTFGDWLAGLAADARGHLLNAASVSPRSFYEALNIARAASLDGPVLDWTLIGDSPEEDDESEAGGLVLESAAQIATPANEAENIQRGREAMKHVISSRAKEPRAMYRKDLGWIGFEWGKPGESPPDYKTEDERKKWWDSLPSKFRLFSGGYGLSHIIAKRDWEGRWIEAFKGQKGKDFALSLVEVIARGTVFHQNNRAHIEGQIGGRRMKAVFVPGSTWNDPINPKKRPPEQKREDMWLLSGMQLFDKDQYRYNPRGV